MTQSSTAAKLNRTTPIKKLVVKVGSALLTRENNTLNEEFLKHFVDQVAAIKKQGVHVLIVTSGAVAAGRSEVTPKKESKTIPYRQALSAVGQIVLMDTYRELFSAHDIPVAQALLTDMDFQNRESFLTMRNTLDLLLQMGTIPIINENDVVTYVGFKFGGNDPLAAKVSAMLSVDVMILLTDVDGLFDSNPFKHPDAKLLTFVEEVTDEIKSYATTTVSKKSIGGMITKIESAQYALQSGIPTVIASGKRENILLDILEGREFRGTIIGRGDDRCGGRHMWMRSQVKKDIYLVVDDGCARALARHGSLLAVGITEVHGEFRRGDVVAIRNTRGEMIAFGQINYGSRDTDQMKGRKTEDLAKLFPVFLEEEVMHRDNMVVVG
jgi:glutamate 5-kinase